MVFFLLLSPYEQRTSKQITGISNSEFFFLSGFTEINVCCVYGSNCTLSCNQLDHQDPSFNGRTSLVEDQVTGRKTALMLKKVKVQDEGKYKCFVSNHDGYMWSCRLREEVFCGIYPKPELTWSSSPQSSNTVQQTEEKLYNISSSMKLSDMDGDQLNCTVSTRFNNFTSTWMKPSEDFQQLLSVTPSVPSSAQRETQILSKVTFCQKLFIEKAETLTYETK
uniref:Ig-like domain-containing protein n=1 Tax=Gouania willdenowi TaxID=441366 RepID=A0A8C5GE62_GOUWI